MSRSPIQRRSLRLTGSRTALRSFAFFLNEKRWFFIAIFIGVALYYAPTPEGLTRTGQTVLVMTIVSVILFVTEPVPLPSVALMIIVGQILLLGIDSNIVARSLMSDSVLFIMGSLMLAVAIVKQRLDKRIAYFIVRMTGYNVGRISMGVVLVSGLLASVIGEHTVAAMMLPVAMTLITLVSTDRKEVRSLAAVLLFSISYGCSIAGIGTPSGGARNAIMIGYWREFFYDPLDPETFKYLVGYVKWTMYSYPIFLVQVPIVSFLLMRTFKPKQKDIRRAVVKLRAQIEEQGAMTGRDWTAILGFIAILIGWIGFSDNLGLGTIAILGAIFFLIVGLVRWEDVNGGVNWGVVWLYAAAISLGVQMKDTGAAQWVADSFLALLEPLGVHEGLPLWGATSILTTLVTNTMSNGAAVAVLGPITLNMADAAGESTLRMGFITSISSAFAYLTVVGTPASTIVYASGYLKPRDFLSAGYKMAIISTVILLAFAAFYWPLIGL